MAQSIMTEMMVILTTACCAFVTHASADDSSLFQTATSARIRKRVPLSSSPGQVENTSRPILNRYVTSTLYADHPLAIQGDPPPLIAMTNPWYVSIATIARTVRRE